MTGAKKRMKIAFTLAEVLVTLMIIGVISAITMPTLKKISNDNTLVTAAKKAYETVSLATKNIKSKEGPVKLWVDDYDIMGGLFEKEMNAKSNGENDYEEHKVVQLNGESAGDFLIDMEILDGSMWYFEDFSKDCNLHDSDLYSNACAVIKVDTNGPNKPNIVGLDLIGFYIKSDGTVLPFGSGDSASTASCTKDGTGWGCSAKIIMEGKISW